VGSLRERGERIVEFGRRVSSEGGECRPFGLGRPLEAGLFEGVDVLIHGAYDMTLRKPAEVWQTNVVGTRSLVERACADGVSKVILVSSMSAYEGTRQTYGFAKLVCENLVRRVGGVAVRLGLVYDAAAGGMVGSLRRLVGLPVVPVLGPDAYQYVVNADQVGAAFTAILNDGRLSREIIGLAHCDAVPFRLILASLTGGSTKRFVNVDWRPVYYAMRLAERAGVRLPLRSDSVLGLVHPATVVPNFTVWEELGIEVRRAAFLEVGDA